MNALKELGIEIKNLIPLAVIVIILFFTKISTALIITLAAFVLLDRVRIDYFKLQEKKTKDCTKDCVAYSQRKK